MTDEELQNLIELGVYTKARISDEKLHGNIKNIVPVGLASDENKKAYIKVAKELARRLIRKGFTNDELILYEKLSLIEQSAIKMIRNDSNRDIEHLKGDYVVSSFLEIEKMKRNYNKPPIKRLQLTNKQIRRIFLLKSQNESVREITRQLGLNRGTIIKVLNKDYTNMDDIELIRTIEDEFLSD